MSTDPRLTIPFAEVDPHSPVPLYYQIYLDLRQLIQRGVVAPGGMMPTELEMCAAYRVGRQTVRQAIARLVDESLVERFPGRGTFVRQRSGHTQFLLERSFSRQIRELGRAPHSHVLCLETGELNAGNVPELQALNGAPCLELERLRLADDEPICHQTSIVLTERCPGIERSDFANRSLYEILSSEYQLAVTRFDHVVRATAADEYRSGLLGVDVGVPLLFVAVTAYAEDGSVLERSTSYYRADRYEYRTSQSCC